MPTGHNEEAMNFAPYSIKTKQVAPSSSNRNHATADDVRAQAIF